MDWEGSCSARQAAGRSLAEAGLGTGPSALTACTLRGNAPSALMVAASPRVSILSTLTVFWQDSSTKACQPPGREDSTGQILNGIGGERGKSGEAAGHSGAPPTHQFTHVAPDFLVGISVDEELLYRMSLRYSDSSGRVSFPSLVCFLMRLETMASE